jgi:hypothetical protein
VLIHDAAGWHIANLLRPRRNDSPNAQPVELPSLVVEQGTVAIEDATRTPGGRAGRARSTRSTATSADAVARPHRPRDPPRHVRAAQPALRVAELSAHWTAQDGRHDVRDLHLRTAASLLDASFVYRRRRAGQRGSIACTPAPAPIDFAEFAELVPALEGRPLVLTGTRRRAAGRSTRWPSRPTSPIRRPAA